MGTEIERKFRVRDDSWRGEVISSQYLCQAYVHLEDASHKALRIRIAGEEAFLTLKGPLQGLSRMEFEYNIPVGDAQILIREFCEGPVIEKIRHIVPCPDGKKWEIDEFKGENNGLILAEIELPEENAPFPTPRWLGKEVSGNPAYYNSNLRKKPYSSWQEDKDRIS